MVVELARYLVEQIAADGDEGSSVERLNSFIDEYEQQKAKHEEQIQFDRHARDYAIAIALQHPTIHAGSFVGSSSSIVKQEKINGATKMKAGDDSDEDNDENENQGGASGTASKFINEDIEAREIDFITLQQRHGDKLRLFADEKSITRAISGNQAPLTPNLRTVMVYIMRQRGQGASFPQIMSNLKITNSNLYLQMLNLLEKGLVYKLRNSMHNHLIAKKFAHLSSYYNSHEMILDGSIEQNGERAEAKQEEHNEEEDVTLQHVTEEDMAGQMTLQNDEERDTSRTGVEDDPREVYEDVEGDQSMVQPSASELNTQSGTSAFPQLPNEDAIAALINNKMRMRERILRLLVESPKGIILRQGLTFRLGLRLEYATQGRAVVRAVEEMQNRGLLHCRTFKIDLNGTPQNSRCLVLTEEGLAQYNRQKTSVHEKHITSLKANLQEQAEVYGQSGIQAEVPFERQLMEEVARSGPNGTTIEDLNRFFGGNETRRRDIDRILNTAKTQVTLPQYSDLFISSALGQEGRKRIGRFRVRQWLSYQVSGKASVEKLKLSDLRSSIKKMPEIRLNESDVGNFVHHNNTPKTRGPGKKQTASAQSTPAKAKGRPRKDYSTKALAAAARYRAKKGLPDENGDGMLASASTPEVTRKRGRPRKLARIETDSGAELTTQDHEKSTNNPDESYPVLQSETGDADATVTSTANEPGENMEDRTQAPEDEPDQVMEDLPRAPEEEDEDLTVEQSHKDDDRPVDRTVDIVMVGGSRNNRAPRFNVSMQAKYELLLEFFERAQIVIARRFDKEYSDFVANATMTDFKRKNSKMDVKVRKKLLAALIENGKIVRQFTSIKIANRDTKQTLLFLKGLSGQRISEYLENAKQTNLLEASRGDDRVHRYVSDNTILKEGDLEIPLAGSVLGAYRMNFETSSLDDLLSNPRFRAQIIKHPHIRSAFTGRFEGLVARARLVHQETWKMLNHPPSENMYQFIKGDNVVDLACWAFEPRLQSYLQLATAPQDNGLFSASQNARLLERPLSSLDKKLRDSLELSDDGDGGGAGCRRTLAPVMKFLCEMQLAVPVSYIGHDEYAPVEWDENYMLYKFAPVFEKPIWNAEGHFEPHLDRMKFTSQIDVHLFWGKLDEFRKGRITGIPDEPNNPDDPEEVQWINNAKILKSSSAWDTSYRLFKAQKAFFEQARRLGINASHIDDHVMLKKLSYASVTPIVFVQQHLRRVFGLAEIKKAKTDRKTEEMHNLISNKFRRGERAPAQGRTRVTGPLTLNQVKRQENRIKRRARELREQRGDEFDNLLDTFFSRHDIAGEERDQFTKGMATAREAYSNGAAHMKIDEVKALLQAIQDFIETGETGTFRSMVRSKAPKRDRSKKNRVIIRSFNERRKSRKSVFEWSLEADELLRDCCVILRARDQDRHPTGNVRKNWKALLRIFPFCTMTALHRRFEKLKSAVGEEAYLAQLEVEWTKLWFAFRQTDVLPDDDPKDAVAFDLQVHVDFLRERIDKFAVLETLRNGTNESLPLNVQNLDLLYDLDRPPHTHLVLDNANVITRHYAGDGAGDLRTDHLLRAAFSTFMLDGTLAPKSSMQEQGTFESRKKSQEAYALKRMFLSTADQAYDEALSQKLNEINGVEEQNVKQARNHLISARLCKPKEHEEGRQVEGDPDQWTSEWISFMSDQNFETIPTWQITESAIERATALSTSIQNGNTDKCLEVYRASGNVETAAGILLADRGNVDVEIDLSPVSRLSSNHIFNAKKTTDMQLEVPVRVKAEQGELLSNMLGGISKEQETLLEKIPKEEAVLEWAKDDFDTAKKANRWEKACKSWLRTSTLAKKSKSEATAILERVKSAGPEGIARSNVKAICVDEGFSLDLAADLIVDLLQTSPALAFEAGWDESKLVASIYVNDWTMTILDESQTSQNAIIPRPWFDMYGRPIERIWRDCCALVLQAITINPGLTLSQLICQLQREGALTRMDVCYLIRCAHQEGLIEFVSAYDPTQIGEKVFWMANNDDEVGLVNKNCLI
ncbi:uncharacterized protein FA14DRAFT_188941 [Meira miltonrushii]|uniref:Transcription factor tau subunit sfc3/Tfc3 C-terminal domain-containing protein n=1 Tax=Meira miltonrushii TaxID=1280837 RepID=A0A316VB82_9BASI|nr:uncharacterized protein FA14DRAFT_188941 [Meira miltonrushii]PWN34897.1 hypothetical protein FA14DRAFT_188941 [Meira miltonrushii]